MSGKFNLKKSPFGKNRENPMAATKFSKSETVVSGSGTELKENEIGPLDIRDLAGGLHGPIQAAYTDSTKIADLCNKAAKATGYVYALAGFKDRKGGELSQLPILAIPRPTQLDGGIVTAHANDATKQGEDETVEQIPDKIKHDIEVNSLWDGMYRQRRGVYRFLRNLDKNMFPEVSCFGSNELLWDFFNRMALKSMNMDIDLPSTMFATQVFQIAHRIAEEHPEAKDNSRELMTAYASYIFRSAHDVSKVSPSEIDLQKQSKLYNDIALAQIHAMHRAEDILEAGSPKEIEANLENLPGLNRYLVQYLVSHHTYQNSYSYYLTDMLKSLETIDSDTGALPEGKEHHFDTEEIINKAKDNIRQALHTLYGARCLFKDQNDLRLFLTPEERKDEEKEKKEKGKLEEKPRSADALADIKRNTLPSADTEAEELASPSSIVYSIGTSLKVISMLQNGMDGYQEGLESIRNELMAEFEADAESLATDPKNFLELTGEYLDLATSYAIAPASNEIQPFQTLRRLELDVLSKDKAEKEELKEFLEDEKLVDWDSTLEIALRGHLDDDEIELILGKDPYDDADKDTILSMNYVPSTAEKLLRYFRGAAHQTVEDGKTIFCRGEYELPEKLSEIKVNGNLDNLALTMGFLMGSYCRKLGTRFYTGIAQRDQSANLMVSQLAKLAVSDTAPTLISFLDMAKRVMGRLDRYIPNPLALFTK